MLIHLIRHTTPKVASGICYGNSDLALANSFEYERDEVLKKLLIHYDAVYTSPLKRCTELSKLLHSPCHFEDERLIEYHFGDWELKPWSELTGDDVQWWMDNFIEHAAPNGDSLIDMKTRVDDFWQTLLKQAYDCVAITTHAGVMRLIHANLLDTPLDKLFRLQLDYGAVMEIHIDRNSGLQTIKHL